MQKRMKVLLTMGSTVFGLLLTTSPLLISQAQGSNKKQKTVIEQNNHQQAKGNEETQQQQQTAQEKARKEVAKSAVGSLLLDALTAKDSEWTLQKASYGIKHIDEEPIGINMSYQKGDEMVYITIQEFNSANDAAESFNTPRSYPVSIKSATLGDWGEKIYSDRTFIQMNFRKGNFVVSVSSKNEKTAERFASYAAEAVNNFAIN